jgi:hypothetical protein
VPVSPPVHEPNLDLVALPRAERASMRAAVIALNLVCLDAPLVAIAWQAAFAFAFHHPISAGARLVLFLTTWGIYLGDRLADVATLLPDDPRSTRQRFCLRHTVAWRGAIVTVALADATAIVRYLEPEIILVGAAVGAVVLSYLVANHYGHRYWRALPVKEVFVGTLFAVGTVAAFLVTAARVQPGFRLCTLLLAAACTLNCVHIAAWERGLDERQRKNSLATRFPSLAAPLRIASYVFAAICAAGLVLGLAPRSILALLGLSALCLASIQSSRRLDAEERTALADLAMAVPLLLLCLRPRLWAAFGR